MRNAASCSRVSKRVGGVDSEQPGSLQTGQAGIVPGVARGPSVKHPSWKACTHRSLRTTGAASFNSGSASGREEKDDVLVGWRLA